MALRTIRKRYIVALTILIIFIAGFIFQGPFHNQLAVWNILQKPEEITEIYFTETSLVPSSYTPAQPVTTTFTIRNNTNTTKNYRYAVYQRNESGTMVQELHAGRLEVKPESQKDTKLRLTPVDLGANTQFVIRLIDQPQQINFWVTKS